MDVQDESGLGWWVRSGAAVLGWLVLALLAVLALAVVTVREYVRLRGESSHDRMRRRAGGLV